jgi:hypothetical protein
MRSADQTLYSFQESKAIYNGIKVLTRYSILLNIGIWQQGTQTLIPNPQKRCKTYIPHSLPCGGAAGLV